MWPLTALDELSVTTLQLEATDGSYLGQKTRYRRADGGGDDGGTTGGEPSCQADCAAVSCPAGQMCADQGGAFQWCIPAECSSCGNGCNYNTVTCAFLNCQ